MHADAAGGNLETAMSLFFSMQDGGGGGAVAEPGAADALGFDPPDWYGLVWPAIERVPEAWVEQGFAFTEGKQELLQPKNGPCGVLAAVHGVVVARALAAGASAEPGSAVSDEALAGALAAILTQAAGDGAAVLQLPAWSGEVGQGVLIDEAPVADAAAAILSRVELFKARGGCVLLVYAALLCRGVDQVKADVVSDMGEPPLIVGPHRICSSELMGLLLKGVASGNFGAQNATNTAGNDWPVALGVGMLSSAELDSGITICNQLKSPSQPVWILHGGDHFTLAWASSSATAPPAAPTASTPFVLHHWNGLFGFKMMNFVFKMISLKGWICAKK